MTQALPTTQSLPYLPQPQVNAVKIDIINPQAYGAANGQAAPAQQQPNGYYYNYPTAQAYNMPTNPYYAPAQASAMPQISQVPVPPPPSPMVPPEQNNQVPAQPPAVVDQPTVAPAAIPAAAEVPPAPEVVAPDPSAIDVTALNTALVSNDTDAQTAAIQKIAEIGQKDPAKAKSLLNEQTLQSLVNVINQDTSKLAGPQAGQQAPSALEKAEINKQFGTYTLAVLQKLFREEIDKEAGKQGVAPISILELPGIRPIVENLKNNPNPTIREASISAVNYIARPEDKEILNTLFELSAKQDADPNVKLAAQTSLDNLKKADAAAPAPTKQAA